MGTLCSLRRCVNLFLQPLVSPCEPFSTDSNGKLYSTSKAYRFLALLVRLYTQTQAPVVGSMGVAWKL